MLYKMSWLFIPSVFNVLTMLVWQEELDWNEMLIKRYIGREVYALKSNQLNYVLILLELTLWNLFNFFFAEFDGTFSTNTSLPLVSFSLIVPYLKSYSKSLLFPYLSYPSSLWQPMSFSASFYLFLLQLDLEVNTLCIYFLFGLTIMAHCKSFLFLIYLLMSSLYMRTFDYFQP